jgi:hypothetical protein
MKSKDREEWTAILREAEATLKGHKARRRGLLFVQNISFGITMVYWVRSRDFLQNLKTGCGAHPAPIQRAREPPPPAGVEAIGTRNLVLISE